MQNVRMIHLLLIFTLVGLMGYWVIGRLGETPAIFVLAKNGIKLGQVPKYKDLKLPPTSENGTTLRYLAAVEVTGLVLRWEFEADVGFTVLRAEMSWNEIPKGAQKNAYIQNLVSDKREPSSDRGMLGLRMVPGSENLKAAMQELQIGDLIRVQGKQISLERDGDVVQSTVRDGLKIELIWVDELQIDRRIYR